MVTIQPWLPHPRYPSGTRPYLHSVSTHPDHRGHGLARRLTETLRRINQEVLVQYVSTLVQVTESLTGEDPEPWRLTGRGHDFDALMASYRARQKKKGRIGPFCLLAYCHCSPSSG